MCMWCTTNQRPLYIQWLHYSLLTFINKDHQFKHVLREKKKCSWNIWEKKGLHHDTTKKNYGIWELILSITRTKHSLLMNNKKQAVETCLPNKLKRVMQDYIWRITKLKYLQKNLNKRIIPTQMKKTWTWKYSNTVWKKSSLVWADLC